MLWHLVKFLAHHTPEKLHISSFHKGWIWLSTAAMQKERPGEKQAPVAWACMVRILYKVSHKKTLAGHFQSQKQYFRLLGFVMRLHNFIYLPLSQGQ